MRANTYIKRYCVGFFGWNVHIAHQRCVRTLWNWIARDKLHEFLLMFLFNTIFFSYFATNYLILNRLKTHRRINHKTEVFFDFVNAKYFECPIKNSKNFVVYSFLIFFSLNSFPFSRNVRLPLYVWVRGAHRELHRIET